MYLYIYIFLLLDQNALATDMNRGLLIFTNWLAQQPLFWTLTGILDQRRA